MLQIRLLGQFDVRLDGKRIVISSRAGQSLLAYLAMTAGTPHRREKLAGTLWPDSSDENARKNLRQELWRIRKAIPAQNLPEADDYLIADEYTLTFNRDADYWLDVSILENSDPDIQSLTSSLSLYQGELLPGFYDDWVVLERERLQTLFESKMEQLVEKLVESERWTAVQEQCERWLALGFVSESAYRALMLSHNARGDMAKVSSVYQRCVEDLRDHFGVEPSAETHALFNGLLKGAKVPRRIMPAQPSGTVTFLFTDIQGSTRLLDKLGDQYAISLEEHHRILRAAIQKWKGTEMDTQGDAFFVTFTRALDAVQCAAEAQRELSRHTWLLDEPIRVRMGLHTGEPLIASTGYVGMDVHRAARIGDAGHGGQVLLSQTTRDLVMQDLPSGITIKELGEHRLKDMKYPTPIYQLVIEGLQEDFPPLKMKFTGSEAPVPGEPPFKGLQYFEEADSDLFFGRELLTAKLIHRLSGLPSPEGEELGVRFLSVVIGASGSGKSSLVRAGLIPALRKGITLLDGTKPPQGSTDWQFHILTPTAHPLEALATELMRDSDSVATTARLIDDLAQEPRSLALFLARARDSAKRHTVLVVDQFEELFTLCRDEFEREAFIDNLLNLVSPGQSNTTLIITLRADFYAHLAQYPELRDAVAQQQEYIGPMTAEELRLAIEEPAKRGHWEFEPGLVDLILRDVGDEPGALPLLSHALLETWKRRAGHTLTLKGYADAGGVRGAIAHTAESVYQNLSPEEQTIARNIFLRLTELGEVTEDTRRRASFEELISHVDAEHVNEARSVLNTLAEARLVTLGENTAEVAHEALIREWPALREWLNQDREGLRLHRHLTEAAHEWEILEREAGALYRGAHLAQAREWAILHPNNLNAGEKTFLDASNELEQREAKEHEEQQRRELEAAQKLAETERARAQEQAHSVKQLRRRAVFLAAALIIAGVLALTASVFARQATQRSQESSSRELAAAAIANLEVDPERSLLLALESVSVAHTLEGEDALHQALKESHIQHTLLGHAEWVNRVVFSPDGTRLATSSDDGTARVWDASSGTLLFTLKNGHGDWVIGIAYSPDGKRLATVGADETAKIWDANTGQEILTLTHGMYDRTPGTADGAWAIAFSPDGTKLAIGGSAPRVQVWNIATMQTVLTLPGQRDGVWDLAFSPDGTRLATVGADGVASVWDANTGQEIFVLAGHAGEVHALAFSPDSRYLATAHDNHLAKIWDLSTGMELLSLSGHTGPIFDIAFNSDGTYLATVGKDQRAKVWQLVPGFDRGSLMAHEFLTLSGHAGPISGVAFSPDGTRLATGGADASVRIWDVSFRSGKELLFIASPESRSTRIVYSSDGTRLAGIGTDGRARVWASTNGKQLFSLDDQVANDVVFSPDGTFLVTAEEDGTVKVWDAASGKRLHTLYGHTYRVNDVAFSSDGKRIVTASFGEAIVWDHSTGKELLRLTPVVDGLLVVAFSPDGNRLAMAGQGGTVEIHNATTGKMLLTFTSQSNTSLSFGGIKDLVFSRDGSRLATGNEYGLTEIWDTKTGNLLLIFAGHASEVTAVDFNSDGSWLATSSQDGTVKIWDMKTGRNRLTLGDSNGAVSDVAFNLAGTRLAASDDSGIRVYALRIEDLIALARSRLTRSLTTEECQKYLHLQECSSVP